MLNLTAVFAGVVRWAYRRGVVPGIDTRGIPTNECLNCGSNVFDIRAGFDDYDIAFWFTEARCASCKTPLTAPTPCDHPDHDCDAEHEAYDYESDDDDD